MPLTWLKTASFSQEREQSFEDKALRHFVGWMKYHLKKNIIEEDRAAIVPTEQPVYSTENTFFCTFKYNASYRSAFPLVGCAKLGSWLHIPMLLFPLPDLQVLQGG